jgi:tryptophan halogenase
MSGEMIRSIAIVGGGIAGWCAAVTLARSLGRRCEIAVVETGEEAAHEPLALSALPTSADFHALVGGDEAALMRATRATFKLGQRCEGWSGKGSAYFEPFGPIGVPIEGAAFHHALLRLGRPDELADYSLGAVAARLGRFAPPSEDLRSVRSTLAYAHHFDAAAYAGAMRALAVHLGVQRLEGALAAVETAPGERIAAVRLAGGRRLAADLFLDATGPEARLLGGALREPFEDWSEALPFDSRVETLRPAEGPPAPYTTLTAEPDGWRTRIPLQGAVGEAFSYRRDQLSDDEAAARLGGGGRPRLTRLRLGRRGRAWLGNCLALGETAGIPAPDLPLHLAHSAVLRLLKLIPYRDGFEVCAAEYNRLWTEEQARLRDFALLRFRANGRQEPLWEACRTGPAPDSLDYRIDQFRSRGRAPLFEEEVFPEASWVAVLLGQGVRPERHDFRVDAVERPALERQLTRVRAAIAEAAEAMPIHEDALRRAGAAIPEGASA